MEQAIIQIRPMRDGGADCAIEVCASELGSKKTTRASGEEEQRGSLAGSEYFWRDLAAKRVEHASAQAATGSSVQPAVSKDGGGQSALVRGLQGMVPDGQGRAG